MRIIAIALLVTLMASPVFGEAFSLRQAPYEPEQPLASEFMQTQTLDGDDLGDYYKSPSKAFLYSLLLPGAGQKYVGANGQATAFFAIEGAIWVSFAIFLIQEDNLEEDYKNYASAYARVQSAGHSAEYYEIIGEYSASQDYEDEIKSRGRLELYPDVDNQTLDDYFVENRVQDYESWLWASEETRALYRNKRFASRRAERRATYALWAAAANRVVSSIFAIKAARDHNSAIEERAYHFEIGPPRYDPGDESFQTGLTFVGRF